LLRASFRPPEAICALRTLWRHRGSLLEMAAEHILHMQKALSQMNLQLHHVLSDITGTSGQAIRITSELPTTRPESPHPLQTCCEGYNYAHRWRP
jgi:hypothetical protein